MRGGATKHFQIIVAAWPLLPPSSFVRLWTVYSFDWGGGELYPFLSGIAIFTQGNL